MQYTVVSQTQPTGTTYTIRILRAAGEHYYMVDMWGAGRVSGAWWNTGREMSGDRWVTISRILMGTTGPIRAVEAELVF